MRAKGIKVIVADSATSAAARDCIALVARFRRENPAQWLEDWGGGNESCAGFGLTKFRLSARRISCLRAMQNPAHDAH